MNIMTWTVAWNGKVVRRQCTVFSNEKTFARIQTPADAVPELSSIFFPATLYRIHQKRVPFRW